MIMQKTDQNQDSEPFFNMGKGLRKEKIIR